MSRYIDPNEPLSDDDRRYLRERGKYRYIQIHDQRIGSAPAEFDGSVVATTPPPAEGAPAGSGPVGGEAEKSGEPEPDPDMREYVNGLDMDELREELKKAELSTSGKKAELQQRLLQYLAAQG